MPIGYLPDKETPEAKKYIERFLNGDIEALQKELGYGRRGTLYRSFESAYEIGYKDIKWPIKPIEEMSEELPVINLPAIKLYPYKPAKKRGKGDPETQVLLLGDHHAGEITPTFNEVVYRNRLAEICRSTLTITYLHRNSYPVNDLVIVMGGDMIHGENPKQGAKVGNIKCGAQEQIYEIALPELLNLILTLKQEFKTIKIYTVRGNHGRYSLYAPNTSNWDMMLYKSLRPLLATHDIETHISDDFNNIFGIQGFQFFTFHGDQVRAHQGIPYFALERKVKSWFITYDGFHYALCFHWHKDDYYRISAKTKMFLNGALVSDDPFALEVIGTSTIPTQWTFGVHKENGVTWVYSLISDKKFLPQPKEELK